ncbi:MAG TPA: hypothetical protein VII53_06715 [Solirubrobacteraceae bacterium]
MRMSLSSRAHCLALLPILAGALFALALPSAALAAEPCPNEPYRVASDSTQLPNCRAYELVSPADAGAPVGTDSLEEVAHSAFIEVAFNNDPFVAPDGSLAQQLRGALDVQGSGEDVFWNSTATPPRTGAVEDAGAWDPFRSIRTSTGWSTRDLLPSSIQIPGLPGGTVKVVLGASADGSSALVLAQLALYPSAFANPQQAALGEQRGFSIYRVSTDGGFAPQLVTHGELLLPENETLESLTNDGPFQELSASPNLEVVTFRSTIRLASQDNCIGGPGNQFQSQFTSATTYIWNAGSIDGLARPALPLGPSCVSPNVTSIPTVLPDGDPILMPNPANISMLTSGPLVQTGGEIYADPILAGPSGGTLLSVAPDGSTAYVLEKQSLVAQDTSGGGQIYAIGTQAGVPQSGLPLPGDTKSVACVSCTSDQTNVSYVGTSKDGTHILFTTDQGLWEWDVSSPSAPAARLTSVTDLGPLTVTISENGHYVVGLTSQLAHNPEPDLYEFSADQVPTVIASGGSADIYSLDSVSCLVVSTCGQPYVSGGVSNDGQRVVYNARPAEEVAGRQLPQVIDEWHSGHTTQLSPAGSLNEYAVQTVTGGELQDVFFFANDALVPWDFNAGQSDIYDARVEGGFPFCTPGDPGPPPGMERCGSATSNSNPTSPQVPGYVANLTPPGFQLASLPADTSQPAGGSAAKALTQAQKLSQALKACKKQSKKKRAACVKRAKKRYATTTEKGKGKR